MIDQWINDAFAGAWTVLTWAFWIFAPIFALAMLCLGVLLAKDSLAVRKERKAAEPDRRFAASERQFLDWLGQFPQELPKGRGELTGWDYREWYDEHVAWPCSVIRGVDREEPKPVVQPRTVFTATPDELRKRRTIANNGIALGAQAVKTVEWTEGLGGAVEDEPRELPEPAPRPRPEPFKASDPPLPCGHWEAFGAHYLRAPQPSGVIHPIRVECPDAER